MTKVLVVDDEVEVVEFLKSFLMRKGAKVITATNARDAVEIFTKENPQIVILDVRMPGEDGFFVLEKIREVSLETKVIMVTAREDKTSISKAKKFGAEDYLIKPIELEVLDSLISQYIKTNVQDIKSA